MVALALNDPGLREQVKNDMRASRFTTEHKLPFRHYLQGPSGAVLFAAMAKKSGRGRPEILSLLDRMPPLEFYMPVRNHRETWTGGRDLLVAGTLDEAGTTLVGYDLTGQPLTLSIGHAPETPTLVLVPVETDFSSPLPTSQFININNQEGKAIGTYARGTALFPFRSSILTQSDCDGDTAVIECGGESGGGGSTSCPRPPSGTVQRRGVSVEEYITCMRALNDHESWPLGNPEFYLLLGGKYSGGADFQNRINIPESMWAGDDDAKNARWRPVPNPLSLMVWDTDLGTRITVQCFEDDFDWGTDFTVRGSSKFPPTNFELSYAVTFRIGNGDDNCGSAFINLQNTLGEFYYIPDGLDDDLTNPAPPYHNGTSDLQWWGYGIRRL
jgi:hypothetical protein